MGWNFPLLFNLIVAPWAVVIHVIWNLLTLQWRKLKWVTVIGIAVSFVLVGLQLAVLYFAITSFI
ncbi:hypothetical protein ACFVS2_21990 [Brevibacillus sp. NPDC058079]|uniref:hypothetical protein n=1 Tax=Brevibacillus sp. NPDC058079 TaxID=3346330 RepID=UPI0036EC4C48